jgi:hypothetical protein
MEVIYVGGDRQADPLSIVLAERLSQFDVQYRPVRVASADIRRDISSTIDPRSTLARVWVDTRGADSARIYLLESRRGRLLFRDVPFRHGLDEVAREEIANIVEGAVGTLLAGGDIGGPRDEVLQNIPEAPGPVADRPVQPAPRVGNGPASVSATVGAFWEAGAIDGHFFTHGPGMVGRLSLGEGKVRPALRLSGQYRLPVAIADKEIGVDLQVIASRVSGGIDLALSDALMFSPTLGIGLDATHIAPEQNAPNARLDSSRWSFLPAVRASVELRARFISRLYGTVDLAAETDPTGTHYFLRRDGVEEAVLVPWRVRPSAAIGLALEL